MVFIKNLLYLWYFVLFVWLIVLGYVNIFLVIYIKCCCKFASLMIGLGFLEEITCDIFSFYDLKMVSELVSSPPTLSNIFYICFSKSFQSDSNLSFVFFLVLFSTSTLVFWLSLGFSRSIYANDALVRESTPFPSPLAKKNLLLLDSTGVMIHFSSP
jgi:hypothetical protein